MTEQSPSLFLQQLAGGDQALALLHLRILKAPGGATTRDLLGLIDEFRLPRPANLSTTLARLERRRLVRRAGKLWQLTPEGERVVGTLAKGIRFDVTPPTPGSLGAPFGSVRQDVVPHYFAPDHLQLPIARILEQSSFDENVLLITRFPRADRPQDPLHAAVSAVRDALASHGLRLHLASDRNADDGLFGNVIAHMWACRYGVAIIEDRLARGLNQNLLVELGAMAMTGRRCALLRDRDAPNLPTDLLDRLYRPVDLEEPGTVADQVHRFARDDLRLASCAECPTKAVESATA